MAKLKMEAKMIKSTVSAHSHRIDGEAPSTAPKLEDKNLHSTDDRRFDHHNREGDYIPKISKEKLDQMTDKYERFQYMFPFYRMDVSGYVHHLKVAMKEFQPDRRIFNINIINLASLQKGFNDHRSWKAMKHPESDLVRFLQESCGRKENDTDHVSKDE